MSKSTIVMNNKTGVSRQPDVSKDMMTVAKHVVEGTDVDEYFAMHNKVVRDTPPPAATMPPPANPDLAVSSFLIDKLGERIAFERSGVRLYDALLLKFDVLGSFKGGPSRDELEHLRNEELAHFALLTQVMGRFGGDPTAVTPSANLTAVESQGLLKAISDPRMTLADSLHAMLVAELADNAAWQQLIEIVEQLEQEELAVMFRKAWQEEQEHLSRVQAWLTADTQVRLGQS